MLKSSRLKSRVFSLWRDGVLTCTLVYGWAVPSGCVCVWNPGCSCAGTGPKARPQDAFVLYLHPTFQRRSCKLLVN